MRKLLILPMLLFCSLAIAIDSTPPLEDAELRARYEALTGQFRCLVCQNESIADSNADLAADLRREVRELLLAGKTDQQIAEYMTSRYGDFVLYKPPLQANTVLLWTGPLLLLLIALGILLHVLRQRAAMPGADTEDPDT